MKKLAIFALCMVMFLSLSGCGNKKAITSEKFIFVPERNYEVIEHIKNYSDWGKENCILEGATAYKELHCEYNFLKNNYLHLKNHQHTQSHVLL